MTILLVEDEYLIALKEIHDLNNYGYGVVHASTGEKAIKLLDEQTFDLILMDINLNNNIDGIETAEIILRTLDIPIIFVSSHTEKEIVSKTEKVTSYGYVVKSSTITVLDASIKMAMKLFMSKKMSEKYERGCRDNEEELKTLTNNLKLTADEMIRAERIAKVGNWKLNLNTNRITGSLGAQEIYGLHGDEFDYSDTHNKILPEYKLMSDTAMERLITLGENYNITAKIRRGADIIDILSMAEYDADTNIVFGVIKDITEEVELKLDSDSLFHSMFVEQGTLMWLLDADTGTIIDVNESIVNFYGYTKTELIGMPLSMIDDISTNDNIHTMNTLDNKYTHFDRIHTLKDGTKRFMDVDATTFIREGKKILFAILYDVTKRVEADDEIKRLIKEKEILLKEIHHRIKNNMSMVMSLLSLQSDSTDIKEVKEALGDASSRISGMMVLYDKLYRSKSGTYDKVLLDEYIDSLIEEFKMCYFAGNGIIINKDIDDIELDIKLTQTLGIIINELLTNIAKYAFPYSEHKQVDILIKSELNFITLIIADNGVGMPVGFNFDETSGFGLQLISGLVESLKGTIRIDDEWKGTKVIIEFKYLNN